MKTKNLIFFIVLLLSDAAGAAGTMSNNSTNDYQDPAIPSVSSGDDFGPIQAEDFLDGTSSSIDNDSINTFESESLIIPSDQKDIPSIHNGPDLDEQ